MVKVYFGREVSVYPLEEIKTLTARGIIEKVVPEDVDRSVYRISHLLSGKVKCISDIETNTVTLLELIGLLLSYTGRFLKPDEPLSSHNLRENDILRILQNDGDSKANKTCDSAMLRECDRLFDYVQKEESGYMHLRLIADVTMPDYLKTFTDMFPELRKDPIACHILGDYYVLKAMVTLPSDEESLEKLRKFHAQHPALLPAINWLLKKNAQKGRGSSQRTPRVHPDESPSPAEPPQITQEMLRQAMALAFGGAPPGGSGRSGASSTSRPASSLPTPPPVPIPVPAAVPEPSNPGPSDHILQLRSRFASQLVQLNEFGFTDEAANLSVLESADGNVEVALDLLIAMREEGI